MATEKSGHGSHGLPRNDQGHERIRPRITRITTERSGPRNNQATDHTDYHGTIRATKESGHGSHGLPRNDPGPERIRPRITRITTDLRSLLRVHPCHPSASAGSPS